MRNPTSSSPPVLTGSGEYQRPYWPGTWQSIATLQVLIVLFFLALAFTAVATLNLHFLFGLSLGFASVLVFCRRTK